MLFIVVANGEKSLTKIWAFSLANFSLPRKDRTEPQFSEDLGSLYNAAVFPTPVFDLFGKSVQSFYLLTVPLRRIESQQQPRAHDCSFHIYSNPRDYTQETCSPKPGALGITIPGREQKPQKHMSQCGLAWLCYQKVSSL